MSVPIWLMSGVCLPPMAVWSLATAWPQSTGVTLTFTSGYLAMKSLARTSSLVPSLPMPHTVSSPDTVPVETSGAWDAGAADWPGAVDAPPPPLPPSFEPHAAIAIADAASSAANRRGVAMS